MAAKSSSDIAANLAKLPPAKKAAVLGGVLAVLGLLYWQFYYSGLEDTKKSEQSKKRRLLDEQAKLDKEMDELNKLKQEHDRLKSELDNIKMALPSEAELASFIDHLQIKAGDAGVNFKSWSRGKEVPVDKYIKVPLNITVTGTFYQLMRFFYLLGPSANTERRLEEEGGVSTAQTGRIVNIENLNLGSASVKNDEILLTAKFTASTFRQEQKETEGATKAAAKPAAKPGGVRAAKEQREKTVEKKTGAAEEGGAERLTTPSAPLSPK